MNNRGFAVFCVLVVGAVYAVRSDNRSISQPPRPEIVKQSATPLETPKLDLQVIEKSMAFSKLQDRVEPSIPQTVFDNFKPRQMFVGVSKVNIRAVPGKNSKLVVQLPAGTELNVIAVKEDWSLIRSRDGKVTGWVLSELLLMHNALPQAPLVQKPKPTVPVKLAPPIFNRSEVVAQIIAFSIQNYSGNCPCLYSTMRNGRSCGGRSAYSRPGGRSPLCYPKDVTDTMIREWLAR